MRTLEAINKLAGTVERPTEATLLSMFENLIFSFFLLYNLDHVILNTLEL